MSRAEKREQAMRKQKDAKQKKILIGLAPLLLLMVVWQGPGMLKAMSGGDKAPPPVVQPEGGPVTPAADPVDGPAPSTATPGDTTATPEVTTLPETNDPTNPDAGQLIAFDRFLGKDPFDQLVKDTTDPDGTTPPGTDNPPPPPDDGGNGGNGGGDDDDDDFAAYTTATLTVNGNVQTVGVRGTFPSNDPVFRLKSLSRNAIKIVLVTGDFSQGQDSVTVKIGKSVTLVSQPDGLRFVITLVSVA